MRNSQDHRLSLASTSLIGLITLYQKTLSPDHGPLRHLYTYGYCRHHPTCSDYGKQQIREYGAVVGSAKLLWRLLHCHPWAKPTDAKILATISRN